MRCYGCGSEQGTSFKLCVRCVEKKNLDRDRQRSAALEPAIQESRYLHFVTNWKLQLGAFVVLLLLLAASLFAFSPIGKYGFPYTFLLALGFLSGLISLVAWAQLWVQIFVVQPVLGIISIILPVGVWFFILYHWDTAKKPFAVHMFSLALCVFANLCRILLFNALYLGH